MAISFLRRRQPNPVLNDMVEPTVFGPVQRPGFASARKPLFGKEGLLSGSFPLSMLTYQGNLPSYAEIRILYRPNTEDLVDGILVATTTCNADGTWQVSGLNENSKYDIVARIPGFNDVLISDVQPVTSAPLSAHFANLKAEYAYGEEVNIQVVALGGRPPYTFTAIELPEDLSIDQNTGIISGTLNAALNLTFQVKVNDSSDEITITGESYVSGDPYWSNVVSLMHFEGVNGSSTFVDEVAGTNWVASRGTPVISTGNKRIGNSSAYFAARNAEISCSQSNLGAFEDKDFTVELYMRPTSIPTISNNYQFPVTKDFAGSYNRGWHVSISGDTGGKVVCSVSVNGTPTLYSISSINVVQANVWIHVAMVRKGGTLYLFVDGILQGTTTIPLSGNIGNDAPAMHIGRIGGNFVSQYAYDGYVDELRITKGVARYTENFTPPNAPFLNF